MKFSIEKEISQLAKQFHINLDNKQLHSFRTHAEMLKVWGRRMNLTAIRQPSEIARRHFLEGIIAGDCLNRRGAVGPFVDIGSGNGFPAVPMAVVCLQAKPLILVESSEKKAAFLRALIRDLGWNDARIEVRRVMRGSDLADQRCRIFTSRGVAISRLLTEGLPFLESGGWCVLFGLRSDFEKDFGDDSGQLVLDEEVRLPDRETGVLLLKKV
jgi:16S rRNA (guanine527-N7)-methyltransferase